MIGGREYITPYKAIHTCSISGIYSQLGDYVMPIGWLYTRWWFQPIWKICSSNWIISPIFGVITKNIWVATTQDYKLPTYPLRWNHVESTDLDTIQPRNNQRKPIGAPEGGANVITEASAGGKASHWWSISQNHYAYPNQTYNPNTNGWNQNIPPGKRRNIDTNHQFLSSSL